MFEGKSIFEMLGLEERKKNSQFSNKCFLFEFQKQTQGLLMEKSIPTCNISPPK